jgi:hypothetical protein
MATPNCPRCQARSFEAAVESVSGYTFKLALIHCGVCGAVVGVMPLLDPGVLGKDIKNAVSDLENQLRGIKQTVEEIRQRV